MQDFIANETFNAVLVMADGCLLFGKGVGAYGITKGEICFNVSMTGYQEIMTDPSYAGQIITFTFPHIGNVGCNTWDVESRKIFCNGLILRQPITQPSNHRSQISLTQWLRDSRVVGLSGIDTRYLTRKTRSQGPQNVLIYHGQKGDKISIKSLLQSIQRHPPLKGMELASKVSIDHAYKWKDGTYNMSDSKPGSRSSQKYHIVVIDYGTKQSILRHLIQNHFKVTVVPTTFSFEDIIKLQPDGVLLSNGPGDPFATYSESVKKTIRCLLEQNIPLFGICMGSQLLALICGLKTSKLHCGHRGANHPVKNLSKRSVEVTSQNHGFCISKESLPQDMEITHVSLFDGSIEGIRHKDRPIFAVQYHPEASPGPHDSHYLFHEFYNMIEQSKKG